MIHRVKDIVPPKDLIDSKWDAIKQAALTEQANHVVVDRCYRKTTLEPLLLLYKNKCAMCERDRGTELQVDHYRPKKPRNNIKDPHNNQPGYYWLAYEWSNLILLCSKCNLKKSNKFPLLNWDDTKRIISHLDKNGINGFDAYCLNWLQHYEMPLLINPEHEVNPERHFVFKWDGSLIGRTAEGKETIIICDLNRKDLRRERLKIREGYINDIKSAFDDFAISKNTSQLEGELRGVFKRIKNNCKDDAPHSLFHVFMFRYFDLFIDKKLPTDLRTKATKYFNNFNK